MMYIGWEHNPQGEFHNEFGVQWGYWLFLGLSWFAPVSVGVSLVFGSILSLLAYGRGTKQESILPAPTDTRDRDSVVIAVSLGAAASFAAYALVLIVLFATAPGQETPFFMAGALLSAALGSWVSAIHAPRHAVRATTSFGVFFLITALLVSPAPAVGYGLAGLFISVAVGRIHERRGAQRTGESAVE